MIIIWYLLHCQKQKEWRLLDICRQNISKAALKDAFVFTYDRMRRFRGEWHLERQLMFPDYVFLESDDETALVEELGQDGGIADFRRESGAIVQVKKSNETFLISLCGKSHHLSMSKGIIQDGITQVTEGPLQGKEETICRIDRHKRLARLAVPGGFTLGGRVLAGLEIVDKN